MSDVAVPRLDWRVLFNRATPPGVRGWARIRAAQIREMNRAMQVAAIGQTFNALFLFFLLRDTVPPSTMATWLGLLAIMMSYAVYKKRQMRRRDAAALPRKSIDHAAYAAIAFGMVWIYPARYFFPFATGSEQLVIGMMTALMMAGAAFIFAPVPSAAGAYVLMMCAATTQMLLSTDSIAIASLGPIYSASMFLIVLINGRNFIARTCLDIALEERRATVSLLLREYEESDADWLWQTNTDFRFQNVSQRFARAMGQTAQAIEAVSLLDVLKAAPRHDQAARRRLAEAQGQMSRREPFGNLVVPVVIGSDVHSIELSGRPRFSKQGRFIGYQGVGSDVTSARRSADRIAHMARHDALTGLPNRLQLLESLEQAMKRSERLGTRAAILLIDLDRFKSINDTLGHVAGDYLLKQVAGALDMVVGDEMTAGRLGGDEFAIVVPEVDSRGALEQLALALIGALHGPFHYREQRLFVGASIGIALTPDDGLTTEELMRNADLALYRAKESAGNGIRFYEPALHARAEERRKIELALQQAVDAGEFALAYQPVVDARSGRVVSCEALLRWTNAEIGPVSPAKFIPIAEDTGLLGRIGEWVLRTACKTAATWPDDIGIAVNVSPRQLQDPGFIVTLMSALSHSGLAARRLELEVTETIFLDLTNNTQKTLEQIQSLGVRLAIDDFGTGYSSLGYLRRARFDTLKIDRSFVQEITDGDKESTAIVRAVVALANSLGMTTVAEGVSTTEQLREVESLGCDKIQGFIYARPLPEHEIAAMLSVGAALKAA